jgi:dipeptidyl aminopeptidase/acylaminoacyl peptidase
VRRPVGSILLGLFLLSQIALTGGRLWPALAVFGPSVAAPGWQPVLPTAARVALALPDTLVLAGSNGQYWRLGWSGTPQARPFHPHTVEQLLPGGVLVQVDLVRLAGAWRLVGVRGAPSWPSPDGRAAAVYDSADGAFWALIADDVRPRPLGRADPVDPNALVWSPAGDRLAYLSGAPAQLWSWQVGHYARALAGIAGRPLAVRADGTLVLAAAGGDPALYLPGMAVVVPVVAGRVVSVAPGGTDALVVHDQRVFLVDLDSGRARPLPLTPALLGSTVWTADGRVAIVRRGRDGRVLLASLGGWQWLEPPAGARTLTVVALRGRRLFVVAARAGQEVTYARDVVGTV